MTQSEDVIKLFHSLKRQHKAKTWAEFWRHQAQFKRWLAGLRGMAEEIATREEC